MGILRLLHRVACNHCTWNHGMTNSAQLKQRQRSPSPEAVRDQICCSMTDKEALTIVQWTTAESPNQPETNKCIEHRTEGQKRTPAVSDTAVVWVSAAAAKTDGQTCALCPVHTVDVTNKLSSFVASAMWTAHYASTRRKNWPLDKKTQRLDPFSRFAGLTVVTDRQTERPN